MWRNSSRIFFYILVLSLRSLEFTLKISSSFLKTFLKKPRQTKMAPPRKSVSQAATATSKGKSMAAGGAGPTDAHPSHLDVHIKDVGEERFPSYCVGGREWTRNPVLRRRSALPNACQPSKAIRRATGEGCSLARGGCSEESRQHVSRINSSDRDPLKITDL